MQYLVISDLHSNLEAVTRVLEDARGRGFDRSLVLGDLVGYGANPDEVIDLVKGLPSGLIVRGNHDKVASGITDGEDFNEVAREAILWTRENIRQSSLSYLRELPEGPMDAGGFLISHGTPEDEEDYLLGELDAAHSFASGEFKLAFFGHTHFSCAFEFVQGESRLLMLEEDHGALQLDPDARYLINPGSVGQPRDHNPKASYALYDSEAQSVEWHRVDYDREAARDRIHAAGLPEVLGQRLLLGV